MTIDITGLPVALDDMNKLGEQSLYLIKPFDIEVHVQNLNRSVIHLAIFILCCLILCILTDIYIRMCVYVCIV
jgi:hypothetical protein